MSFIRFTITFMSMTLASVGNTETNLVDNLHDGIAAFLSEDKDTIEFPLILVS